MQENWKGYMKKLIIFLLLVCFCNVYAVEGYNLGSSFMMCDKYGYGIVINHTFIENEKAFFLNYSSGYYFDFFYYDYISDFNDSYSKYMNYFDVFKEFGVEDDQRYLLRLIWDDLYGENEKTFCHETEDEKNKYLAIKEKIKILEQGPKFIKEEIVFEEEESLVIEDELLKYFDVKSNSENLNVEADENKLVLNGFAGEYELLVSKKTEFDNPARVYQYGEDIIVKYGYGVSNTYKVNVIVNEKKEVIELPKEEVIEKEEIIESDDKISFVPKDTSCFFILKKLVLKIIRFIFG